MEKILSRILSRLLSVGFVVLAWASLGSAEERRSWTNNEGVSIVAQLIKIEEGKVTLLKSGKTYKLSIDTLSSEDQEYIKNWTGAKEAQLESSSDSGELEVSKKGKLLYETDFTSNDGWRVSSGSWVCKDNVVTATQEVGAAHKAHMVIQDSNPIDVIIECEIYIGEGDFIAFTIDDKPKKLGRIAFSSKGIGGSATHRVNNPKIKEKFNSVKKSLTKNEWHAVSIEMLGNQIVATLGEHQISSVDDMWEGKPKRLGLHVTGGPSKYRNLKMWEALPKD